MTASPTGLTRHSLREDARRVLRARIISGELKSDTLHALGTIADELQVSVTPVREALLDLSKDGLIEMVRNRGFRVRTLSEKELDDLVQLRLMIEPAAVRDIAAEGKVSDMATLRRLTAQADEAAEKGNWTEFLDTDRDMHLRLLSYLDNPRLVAVVGQLRDQGRLYGLDTVAGTDTFRRSTLEHTAILDAVENRDGEEAEKLMAQHIRHARGVWAGREEEA
ncbi:MAG: GntR family transcriptional regulator [Alcaligenaceae bacterium]|nr:MAG: GntR family transcriptional regulator [Alcaligenaceae bacterium]